MSEERICPYYQKGNCEFGDRTARDDKTSKLIVFRSRCDKEMDVSTKFSECNWYRNTITLLDSGLPVTCPYRKECSDYVYEDGLGQIKDISLSNRDTHRCRTENECYIGDGIFYIGCNTFSTIFWSKKTNKRSD